MPAGPPGEVHGPFKTDTGCLCLRFPFPIKQCNVAGQKIQLDARRRKTVRLKQIVISVCNGPMVKI